MAPRQSQVGYNLTQTEMHQPFRRTSFTWLAYFLLAFYGYFLNILGPITPFLKDELQLTYTISSLHFTAFAVGMLIVGLFGHGLVQRLGRWRSFWLGAAGLSLGGLLLIAGRTPLVTIGAAFCMGVIGSLILPIVASALSDEHGEQRAVAYSEANVVASLISAAAPLLVGFFARSAGSWRLALGLPALAPLLLFLGFRKARPPAPASSRPDLASGRNSLPGLFWLLWVALVLGVAVEFCMISWSADYLENVLGMPQVAAAQSVSLFLAGMIVGRLAASRLVQRFAPRRVVSASVLLAGAGFLVYWLTTSIPLGLGGLFVTGLGVASLYPLILALALGAARGETVQASARTTLASGAAILALPLVLGRLADAITIRPAYAVVALLLIGVLAIVQLAEKLSG
ncbi:MAG: MFS transporter [Chloroflexota bacterium]